MDYTVEIKDAKMEYKATAAQSRVMEWPAYVTIIDAVTHVNDTLPMLEYHIARVGTTDVWNITAEATDGRTYIAQVTYVAGDPRLSFTNVAESTLAEVDAFLSLLKLFGAVLLEDGFSMVDIGWVQA